MASETFIVRRPDHQRLGSSALFLLITICISLFAFSGPYRVNASPGHLETKRQILSWSVGGTVKVWDAVTGAALLTLKHDANVRGAVWNMDKSRILSWSDDATARIWDAATGTTLLTLKHAYSVVGAAWNRLESQILSWSGDGTVCVWDADR